jgi:pyruvate dehydrogenase (quinone)
LVADVIIETLKNLEIDHIYGIVGDSLNAITDAVKRNNLQWIGVRHEEVAAFAAGAESQLTDKLTVCAGSCGPGNMHLINGLYDCHRSNTPVLALAAHIESNEIGSQYFQETHPQFLFKECSYFCELVSSPEQIPRLLRIAIQTAIHKRGVSVLVIPGDIAKKNTSANQIGWHHFSEPIILPRENEVKKLVRLLDESKKITLLCGIGCKDAVKEVKQLAKILKAPIVHTLRAKDLFDFDNPYNVGMTGLIGISSGYYAIEDCDILLMLGTDFPYRQFLPSKGNVIQIDQNGENIGRRIPIKLGLVGTIKETIIYLSSIIKEHQNTTFLNKALLHYQKTQSEIHNFSIKDKNQIPIHPQYLTSQISKLANEDTIFTCDVGTVTIWAARYLKMNVKRKLLGSFKHGSMASALPQAIGAQIAYPNRTVIALCGDGGFTMLMGDIITIKQFNLPIKIIIYNNSDLAMVDLEMKAEGLLNFGTKLNNPDFSKLGKAIGIHSIRIEDPNLMKKELSLAFKHKGPVLIDVVINRIYH